VLLRILPSLLQVARVAVPRQLSDRQARLTRFYLPRVVLRYHELAPSRVEATPGPETLVGHGTTEL